MKLILVSISSKETSMSFPLGISILKTVLDGRKFSENLTTRLLHFYLEDEQEKNSKKYLEILNAISNEKPDIIGFSTYIWNREAVVRLTEDLKKILPGTILMAGGAEATANPLELFRDSALDYIVRGDGETVISAAIENLISKKSESLKNLPGLLQRTLYNEEIPGAIEPVYNEDITAFASPFLAETLDISGFPGILWETARGCPYKCSFCYESKGRQRIALHPYDKLEDELKFFALKGIDRIFVLDPSFNVSKKHALKILDLIGQYTPETHYTFEIKGEELDEELAAAFGEINCYLQLGLQSSNPKALKKVNRVFDRQKFTDGCELLHRYGVPFGLDLIYGLPGDNFDTFLESLDFALNLQPENLDIFPLAILPGTKLGDEAERLNLQYDKKSPYLIESTSEFPAEEIKKAERLTEAADTLLSGDGVNYWFLPVTEAAGLSPSELLSAFSQWFEKTPKTGKPLPDDFREKFGAEILDKHNAKNSIPAAISLIRLYRAIELTASGTVKNGLETTLFYSPEELENMGMVSLNDFPSFFAEHEQTWIVFIEDGELGFSLKMKEPL